MKNLPVLSLCGVLLGASSAPAQNANSAPQNLPTGDATAFAQIGDAAPKKRILVPPADAPLDIPLKPTNYPVPAGAIIVSPDAKPGGAGTQNSPATLKNALQNAPAGATIVLRGGLYRDGNLVIPHRLTLQSFPGELPWIDGSDIVTGWVKDGENAWRRDGWNFAFPPIFDAKDIEPAYPLANNRDMVWVNGRYLTQVGSREEVGPSRFFVDYSAKKLFIGDDPAGKTVEATTRANGLMLRPRDAAQVAGSVIRGLGVRRFADAGLQIAAPRVTIENSVAAWNGIFGLQIVGGATAAAGTSDVTLRGVRASCNGKAGVRTWGTPRLLVENSTFTHNNIENYRRAWGAAGIKMMKSDGVVFRNNVVADNYAFGLWLDEDLNDATVVNNIARGNAVAGIMFEISHRALIAFNVVHDNNVGLMISNATVGKVFNNTFANNKTAVNVKQWRRPNHQTPEEGDLFLTREIVLKNNLFAQTKPNAKNVFIDAGKGAGAAPEMISALDSNVYVTTAPLTMVQWLAGGKMGEFQDLDAFRAASQQEKNSVFATVNPFVDAAKGDYRLKTGVIAGAAAPLPAEVAAATKVGANVGFGALGS